MIVILEPDVSTDSSAGVAIIQFLTAKPGVTPRIHQVTGSQQILNEIYLVGDTSTLDRQEIEGLPGVERVVKVSRTYAVLGRHFEDSRSYGFDYNGVRFDQDSLHVFAGLCAVDTLEHVDEMMRAVSERGLECTRMGAYKPRSNPYSFQGLGASCLPWVFETAGKYGIKVIAMEVTHDSHVDEILESLHTAGNPTGVMLQIGTRNTQNFELLKAVGRQRELPVLIKRGFGITLEESLNATEYLASEGNRNIVFCLRGMKTNMGDPHRNFVDFSHVPVVKRLTLMPVCIDPSHSVGTRAACPDGVLDIFHATAQGVIAGANMVLVDFHPNPNTALVDGPQALLMSEMDHFLEDIEISRQACLRRRELVKKHASSD
ncbi:MAG: 3-deoxy-7-phosphoheptulonate synthase [marine bacterium B5-7]|nr:MAG: 3-deoxy-7-phosphoheptulonate synthase [marine bacterium B5-7]